MVPDDFAWRRIIVCDGETINGIGGGIVGSRYLGVPRAIISVCSHVPRSGFKVVICGRDRKMDGTYGELGYTRGGYGFVKEVISWPSSLLPFLDSRL